ncbi:unnamed protein product [Chironomus riparius]|uniref:C2H2-type domain-containing protein n=1 Tax=Chironomus riparius TaxID=315576 RepID=A0A9N9RZE2_9DIPT|nr:unnamed protein product [Chironomus riparius]
MDEIKVFKYDKCCCCSRNYKVSSLIELTSNSIIIGDETLLFNDLILDVCFVIPDEHRMKYICEGCKEQLVMFHMFKREVKKYNSFTENIRKLDILVKIDEILNNFEDISDLSVYQNERTIIISKNLEENEHEIPQNEENCLIENEGMMIEEDPVKCLIQDEEYIDEQEESCIVEESSSINIKAEEGTSEYSYKDEQMTDSYNSSEGTSAKRRKKYSYKVNTNDSLIPEQVAWIKSQVTKSEIFVDGKKMFKCQICATVLQIAGSLKKHLRDCHVLKTPDEEDERESKRAFKDEIKNSKILVETSKGTEEVYKCQRCTENRIFRSEGGLKVHLRYNHIKSHVIDAEFVANCKISIEIDGQLKNAWQCPECKKILKSRDSLRNHMKLEHSNVVESLQNSQSSMKEEDFIDKNNIKMEGMSMLSQSISINEGSWQLLTKKKSHQSLSNVVCEPCGLKFVHGSTKREKSQEIHQQLHIILKVVSQSYELPKCEQCKIMFSNNEDLANHLITHDNEEIFTSEGLSFMVATKYKEPIGTAGNNEYDKWKCGHCINVRFKDEVECIEHLMILHSKQLICPVDYLEFNGIRGLSQFSTHMKNKHPEMFPELTITCSYCKLEFSNVFDKLAHMKICDTKEFACDHCSKKFFTKTQLLRHLKIVSGVISFTCDVCSKKCVSAMDLRLHYRCHTNEKTYNCSFPNCLKVFKTPAARSSHMEIHSFIEYECTDCKAIFKQRALLQRHLKNMKCKGTHLTKPNITQTS